MLAAMTAMPTLTMFAKRQEVERLRDRAIRYREIARTFTNIRTIDALNGFADDLALKADRLERKMAAQPPPRYDRQH